MIRTGLVTRRNALRRSLAPWLTIAAVWSAQALADEPAPAKKLASQVVVTRADDQRVGGELVSLTDGRLTLGGDAPQTIPLAEV